MFSTPFHYAIKMHRGQNQKCIFDPHTISFKFGVYFYGTFALHDVALFRTEKMIASKAGPLHISFQSITVSHTSRGHTSACSSAAQLHMQLFSNSLLAHWMRSTAGDWGHTFAPQVHGNHLRKARCTVGAKVWWCGECNCTPLHPRFPTVYQVSETVWGQLVCNTCIPYRFIHFLSPKIVSSITLGRLGTLHNYCKSTGLIILIIYNQQLCDFCMRQGLNL